MKDGEAVDLDKRPTRTAPLYGSKDDYQRVLREHVDRLSALQPMLYAADTGRCSSSSRPWTPPAKTARSSTSCPASTRRAARSTASSIRRPKSWTTTSSGVVRQALPERGRIGIFNRSYYEEVLIVRVHPELLANQGLGAPSRGLELDTMQLFDTVLANELYSLLFLRLGSCVLCCRRSSCRCRGYIPSVASGTMLGD